MIVKIVIAVVAVTAFLAFRSYQQFDADMDARVACAQDLAQAQAAGLIPADEVWLC